MTSHNQITQSDANSLDPDSTDPVSAIANTPDHVSRYPAWFHDLIQHLRQYRPWRFLIRADNTIDLKHLAALAVQAQQRAGRPRSPALQLSLFPTRPGEVTLLRADPVHTEKPAGGAELVLTHPDHWYRERFRRASKSVGISYGQKTPGGWTPHDLRHTCLTNLAIAGVPINGIKEFAGHASIVETQKYLKFMPQSIELAGKASDRLGQLSRAQLDSEAPRASEQSLRLIKNTP